MKNAVKLFLREWKYLLKRPRSLVLMVLVPIFVTCICGSGYGKGYFSDLKMGVVDYSYTKQTREVVEAFRQSPYFDVVGYYNDEDEIAEAMRDGEIVAVSFFLRISQEKCSWVSRQRCFSAPVPSIWAMAVPSTSRVLRFWGRFPPRLLSKALWQRVRP